MSWFQAAQIGLGLLGLGQASRQDRAAEERANKNEYLNSPAGIRAEAEKAGFNPLVFTNQVGGFGSQLGFSGSTSNAIQTLSSTFGDIVNQDMRKQEIELENKRLQELVKQSMLKPNANKITYSTKQVPATITTKNVDNAGISSQPPVTVSTLPDKTIDPNWLSEVDMAISKAPDGSVPKVVNDRVSTIFWSYVNPYDGVVDNTWMNPEESSDNPITAGIMHTEAAAKAMWRGYRPKWMKDANERMKNVRDQYQQFNNARKVK